MDAQLNILDKVIEENQKKKQKIETPKTTPVEESNNYFKKLLLLKQQKKLPPKKSKPKSETPVQETPNPEKPKTIHKRLVIYCEYVGTGPLGVEDSLARVCVVGESGQCLLNRVIAQEKPITDYRTSTTQLAMDHFKSAVPLRNVKKEILEILSKSKAKKPKLIGYCLKKCLSVSEVKWY